MKYSSRKTLVFKKPYIKRSENQFGLKYKETYTLIADEESKTMGVLITRLTQYPDKEILDPSIETIVREFKGKIYTETEIAIKLESFFEAIEHINNILIQI